MLTKVKIRGFRGVRSAEVELEKINLTLGVSGMGKSHLLYALDFLRLAANADPAFAGRLGRDIDEGLCLRHWDFKGDERIAIDVEGRGGNALGLEILNYGKDSCVASVSARGPRGDLCVNVSMNDLLFGQGKAWLKCALALCDTAFIDALRGMRVYDFAGTMPFRHTAKLHHNRYLAADGSNLAAWLYLMRERYPDEWRWFMQRIKMRYGFIKRFVLVPNETDFIRVRWEDVRTGKIVDGARLPRGAGVYIALCALLCAPERMAPRVILLDCPEAELDARQAVEIAELIGFVGNERQIIATSRGGRFADIFEARDVIIAYRAAGGSEYARLDPARHAISLEDRGVGELFEMNHLGGIHAPEWQEGLSVDRAREMYDAHAMTFGYKR